jgi:hypothetical protein
MILVNRRPFTTGLAAAIAAIVTLSLITPPPNVDVASSRVEVPAVQLAAATTAEISSTAVNTFVRLASAVAPARVVPTSGTHPAAPNQGATTAAALPPGVTNVLDWIGTIALGTPIAAIWYLAFPLTLPLSYWLANTAAKIGPILCIVFTCTQPPPPPPTTPLGILKLAAGIFLTFPFLLANFFFPSGGPFGSPASVAASAPAFEVKTKPLATKFARLITTTLNTVKAQTGAAAPILPTVAPKPLTSAEKTGAVVGKPQVSHSGSLRTAVASTTSNLNNAIKHAISTISKKAQN